MSRELYLGLMSGTSLDGVDAVLAQFEDASPPRILAQAHRSFEPPLRAALLALNAPADDELERAATLANELARRYADATRDALERARVEPRAVRAIGCHGQTVRHNPARGYTIQIGNAALLAELTGIAVVADFRSRDVAAGGQGAPLAPAFHAAFFGSSMEDRAVLNVGGIANVSCLARGTPPRGFDTGPGNCLMDLWIEQSLGRKFDERGAWSAGAPADRALLELLLDEPYFRQLPPKSTGRDLFNERWLGERMRAALAPQVVQATLLELTARSAAQAIGEHFASAARVIVCGGGARNDALMQRLAVLLGPRPLEASSRYGIDAGLVEAAGFAWLARRAIQGEATDLASVTGARGPRVLGALYKN